MALSFYNISVPQLDRALAQLQICLDKGSTWCTEKKIDEAVVAKWRLFPDMLPFDRQVQIACDFSKFFGARIAGVEAPKFEDTETSLAELSARCQKTRDFLATLTPSQFEGAESRTIEIPMRDRKLSMQGDAYLLKMVFPNVYFHVATAYDILRQLGVPLGKADFVGPLQ
jgi:uncharacterized protein